MDAAIVAGFMSNVPDQRLHDLPPSAKLVFVVLEQEGPLTQKQLAAETLLSARTVRYGLTELEEIDIIETEISFVDARQKLYSLASHHAETGGAGGSDSCAGDGPDCSPGDR